MGFDETPLTTAVRLALTHVRTYDADALHHRMGLDRNHPLVSGVKVIRLLE